MRVCTLTINYRLFLKLHANLQCGSTGGIRLAVSQRELTRVRGRAPSTFQPRRAQLAASGRPARSGRRWLPPAGAQRAIRRAIRCLAVPSGAARTERNLSVLSAAALAATAGSRTAGGGCHQPPAAGPPAAPVPRHMHVWNATGVTVGKALNHTRSRGNKIPPGNINLQRNCSLKKEHPASYPRYKNIQRGEVGIVFPPVHKTPGLVFLTVCASYKECNPLLPC